MKVIVSQALVGKLCNFTAKDVKDVKVTKNGDIIATKYKNGILTMGTHKLDFEIIYTDNTIDKLVEQEVLIKKQTKRPQIYYIDATTFLLSLFLSPASWIMILFAVMSFNEGGEWTSVGILLLIAIPIFCYEQELVYNKYGIKKFKIK